MKTVLAVTGKVLAFAGLAGVSLTTCLLVSFTANQRWGWSVSWALNLGFVAALVVTSGILALAERLAEALDQD